MAALTSDDRGVAKGGGGEESNNNNLDNEAMYVDRREGKGEEMREGGRTATRGSMEEKGRDRRAIVLARMCLPRPEPVARMNQ